MVNTLHTKLLVKMAWELYNQFYIFQLRAAQVLVKEFAMALIVVNVEQQEIAAWID